MPRLHLKHRGTYAPSGRARTPSPGPRGNSRLSTALSVLPPGRIAHELQKLEDIKKKKKKKSSKLAAVKAVFTRKKRKESSSDSDETVKAGTVVRPVNSRGRSRVRVKVTVVKGRSRSRSLSNKRLNAVSVKSAPKRKRRGRRLTRGLSCVAPRSRSCTPERNVRLRVQPIEMPSVKAKPDGPVPLKGNGLFIFQDKENLDPQSEPKSDSKGGSKHRMWDSFRKKVKGAAGKADRGVAVVRSSSVKPGERPPRPEPRQRRTSCSSCSCSRDTSTSTASSGSVFSHLSLSPPNLPAVTIIDRDNNNIYSRCSSVHSTYIQNRPLPPPPVPRDAVLDRRPSVPTRRRVLTSVSSSSSSSSCGSNGGVSSGYGSLPRLLRPPPPPPPPPPPRPPPPRGKVTHVRTIKMDKCMTHKWVTGVAFGRKGELVVVDLRDCCVIDPEDGSLKRQVRVQTAIQFQT